MPDLRRANCRNCRGHTSKVGPISWRGLCLPCGLALETQAITELAEHQGPVFDHWRERLAASVGATVLDAPAPRA